MQVLRLRCCVDGCADGFPFTAAQGETRHLAALEGKLLSIPGQGPVLRIHEKDQPLSATTTYLFHTLLDKRLSNREVRSRER